ncbi:hypothetical protein G3485_07540 [Shewanella baltica]|uniref:hypothetical protein n=1 Tax=Shewanella baltica TaxID=62322 RepID=UPI00217EF564|nr:hypothetical protein [Shewanella baltica]MCS6126683.1 hypothetical protein [Shewanella baltica]MCS6138756.1 hypothetical protein [Shewanella baltica]MCS6144945.1 hypothetical protein [Shewanella baltica]MCS6169475.1 hypothetical protein [Shewanella baltica]MCS6186699.1 hypothetical protein [Shewanella baltica]
MAKVLAIALKSFYLGNEVKTRASEPFEVDEHHFNELKHNKLVERAPEEKTEEADAKAAAEAETKAKEEADAKAAAEAEAKAKEEAETKAAAAAAKKAKA